MPKTARMEFRLTQSQKELIKQAAQLEGRSLSEFATGALVAEARRVLAEQRQREEVQVSQEAFAHLVEAIKQSPQVLPDLLAQLRKAAR